MMPQDIINGLFELFGAWFGWKNAFHLMKDKDIQGVYWPAWAFWSIWGIWNLYYYPSLDQWMSFLGGVVLVAGNLFWVLLVFKYGLYKTK